MTGAISQPMSKRMSPLQSHSMQNLVEPLFGRWEESRIIRVVLMGHVQVGLQWCAGADRHDPAIESSRPSVRLGPALCCQLAALLPTEYRDACLRRPQDPADPRTTPVEYVHQDRMAQVGDSVSCIKYIALVTGMISLRSVSFTFGTILWAVSTASASAAV